MAQYGVKTSIPWDDPSVMQKVRKAWLAEAYQAPPISNPTNGLCGTTMDSPIYVHTDIQKGDGSITWTLDYELREAGVYGNTPVELNAEGLDTSHFTTYVGQWKKAVQVEDVAMTEQNIGKDLVQHLGKKLPLHYYRRLDGALLAFMTGWSLANDQVHVGRNTVYEPSTNRLIRINDRATPGDLKPSDTLTHSFFQAELPLKMDSLDPLMRPAKTPWGDYYIVLLDTVSQGHLMSPDAAGFYQLTADTMRSMPNADKVSPLFKNQLIGAHGEFLFIRLPAEWRLPPAINGAISNRVATAAGNSVQANTVRIPVIGACGACISFGQGTRSTPFSLSDPWEITKWVGPHDQDKQVGYRSILGIDKPRFNNRTEATGNVNNQFDYGCVVIEAYAKLDSAVTASEANFRTYHKRWLAMNSDVITVAGL